MSKHNLSVIAVTITLCLSEASRADFIVRDVRSTGTISSLADADSLLAGNGVASQAMASRTFIDMFDQAASTGEGDGHYTNDQPFPDGTPGVAGHDFAVETTATVIITMPGTYTFGTNSDDGVRLMIDQGAGLTTIINDSGIHSPQDSLGTATFATPGTYALDLVYFQRGGEASVELFAAGGTFTSFDASVFRLVGDTANGGLATVRAVPEPGSIVHLSAGCLGLLVYVRRQRRSAA